MTFVTNDGLSGDWYFEDGIYTRLLDGRPNAKIAGVYLPEPNLFRQQSGRELAPTAKVLWDHWNAN